MSEIVAVDVGGTHARFALADVDGGRIVQLGHECVFKTAEHASFQTAWDEFANLVGRKLPASAGIAVAAPVDGEVVELTNNPWVIRVGTLAQSLGLDRLAVVNDLGAVAHAVAQLEPSHFRHLCGPPGNLPEDGVISIIGAGTGLGVALLFRDDHVERVIETEGGHIDFAPLDAVEDQIVGELRTRFRRVSAERIASGQGLRNIYDTLARIERRDVSVSDEKMLWEAAIAGQDHLATAALERFCLALGAVTGDIALAHGAGAVVIGGGLGLRLVDHLPRSGFRERFIAKGRFERRMDAIPVKIITHDQAGLFGAAAAFAAKYPNSLK